MLKVELIIFTSTWLILKIFEPNLLKIDKKSYKDIGIYNIRYITIKKNDAKYAFDDIIKNEDFDFDILFR